MELDSEIKLPKIKILFIEDEMPLRKILIRKLEKEGFEAFGASDAKEGLVNAITRSPDLILLDIRMPGVDGLTMLKQLRQTNQYGKNVPVILLTNFSANNEEIIEKVVATRPAYYLVKSDTSMDQVVKRVKEQLHIS